MHPGWGARATSCEPFDRICDPSRGHESIRLLPGVSLADSLNPRLPSGKPPACAPAGLSPVGLRPCHNLRTEKCPNFRARFALCTLHFAIRNPLERNLVDE